MIYYRIFTTKSGDFTFTDRSVESKVYRGAIALLASGRHATIASAIAEAEAVVMEVVRRKKAELQEVEVKCGGNSRSSA